MQSAGSLRHLSITTVRCKQLPKTGAENHAWAHSQRYKFRRAKPHQHRPDYQRNEQEVLWDQILQPHYPTAYRFPGERRFETIKNLLKYSIVS